MSMMRRLAILISMLTAAGGATAQAQEQVQPASTPQWLETIAPGFDTVVHNSVEYRKLLDKFSDGVVWMSARDCAIAYWGFPMQPGFTPQVAGESDMQRAIMAEDYASAYALGTEILRHAPVNLTALYWTLFAATETRQPWEVRNSLKGRYNNLTHIISLSGDGTSPPTAFRVVWDMDMYTYTMLELGLGIGDRFLWDNRWTEFEVTPGAKFYHKSIFYEQFPAP